MLTVLDKELQLERKSFFHNLVSLCSKMYGDNKELRSSIERMRKEGNDRSVSIMCRTITALSSGTSSPDSDEPISSRLRSHSQKKTVSKVII